VLVVEVLVREEIDEGASGCYTTIELCSWWFVVVRGGRR